MKTVKIVMQKIGFAYMLKNALVELINEYIFFFMFGIIVILAKGKEETKLRRTRPKPKEAENTYRIKLR